MYRPLNKATAADLDLSEGRVRKFPRTNGADHARRKSMAPAAAAHQNSGANVNVASAPRPLPAEPNKPNFRGRRPSVREHKAPLGPRPYEKQR